MELCFILWSSTRTYGLALITELGILYSSFWFQTMDEKDFCNIQELCTERSNSETLLNMFFFSFITTIQYYNEYWFVLVYEVFWTIRNWLLRTYFHFGKLFNTNRIMLTCVNVERYEHMDSIPFINIENLCFKRVIFFAFFP